MLNVCFMGAISFLLYNIQFNIQQFNINIQHIWEKNNNSLSKPFTDSNASL